MSRALAILVVVLLAACERPFVDVRQPNVVVVSPDLAEVLQQPHFVLKLRAGSFRSIDRVAVNGVSMEYVANDRTWTLALSARRGLNTLIIEAVDSEGASSVDTAYALHLPSQYVANSPPLPSGRGGHTATRTQGQDILVIGGASRAGGTAHATMFILSYPGGGFTAAAAQLHEARTGHTATQLADGRVLVMGGSRTDNVTSVADLVETPEVYDPSARVFQRWVVVGEPIRRTLHTAVYRRTGTEEFVDLYGGLGDTRYSNNPYLGVRSDLRTFQILNDTLIARNSLATAPYLGSALFGHSINRIQIGPYFVFGGRFESAFQEEASFSIEFVSSGGLRLADAPALHVSRTHHAAAPILSNLLLVSGGHQLTPSDIITGTELFSQASGRIFKVTRRPPILPRYAHTATTTAQREVLIIGGFGPDGTARAASEFFVVLPGSPIR